MLRVIDANVTDCQGVEWRVEGNTFPAITGFGIKTKLISIVFPKINITKGMTIDNMLDNIDVSSVIDKVINFLCEKQDGIKLILKICKDFKCSRIKGDGTPISYNLGVEGDFNEIFSGDYTMMYEILFIILKENFGGMFDGEKGLGKLMTGLPKM